MTYQWRWRVMFLDKDGNPADYWTDDADDAAEIARRRDGHVAGPYTEGGDR